MLTLLMLPVAPLMHFYSALQGELRTSRGRDYWLRGPIPGPKPLLCGAPPGRGEKYGRKSAALAAAVFTRI